MYLIVYYVFMDARQMKQALKALDQIVPEVFQLLIGGGAAFVLAHDIPLSTVDIDAIPFKSKLTAAEIDPYVKKVATSLGLPADWLNTYFATFTYSLPKDYGMRLIPVFQGEKMTALALGKEDLCIMKCFARREKDIPHARALLKKGLGLQQVKDHLHQCLDEGLPKAQEALDFFYDLCDDLGLKI